MILTRSLRESRPLRHLGILAASVCAAFFWGCATPAVVFVSPAYQANPAKKVAMVSFQDFPGQEGSGSQVADIFEKYLIKMNYQVVDRSQVTQMLQQENIPSTDQLDPAQMTALGKILGVDAFIFGSLTNYNDTSEQTVMVDIPQEETDPVYGQVTTRQRSAGQVVTTQQTVVTGYSTTFTDQTVPETETLPAVVGLSTRMVSATSHTILWSGSGSADGANLSSAGENVSAKVIAALQKELLKPRS